MCTSRVPQPRTPTGLVRSRHANASPPATCNAVSYLLRANDETTIEQFTLIVADQTGRILKANRFNGTNNRIDFTNVPAGVYNLQVVVNGKIYSKQIVKQ